MVPVLAYLESNAATIGINHPIQFYYFTGALSSFLDNTPTALTFLFSCAWLSRAFATIIHASSNGGKYSCKLSCSNIDRCCIFGSMTYIGNGPNFMVKSIAEEQKIPMPHFFAYMYKFSLIVLLPIFIIVQLLLFINNINLKEILVNL